MCTAHDFEAHSLLYIFILLSIQLQIPAADYAVAAFLSRGQRNRFRQEGTGTFFAAYYVDAGYLSRREIQHRQTAQAVVGVCFAVIGTGTGSCLLGEQVHVAGTGREMGVWGTADKRIRGPGAGLRGKWGYKVPPTTSFVGPGE